jgi:uncharacterized membrane protein
VSKTHSTPINDKREALLSRLFQIGLFFKGFDGLLELVGGVLLLVLPTAKLDAIVRTLTMHELKEDPTDFIATHIRDYAATLTGSATLFAAFYLLMHGIVKVVLVAAVLRGRIGAYPWMMGFLVAFIVYQGYELATHFTVGMLLLTLFDILILALTVHEYRLNRKPATTAGVKN